MSKASDILRERATKAALDGRAHDAAVIAAVAELMDAVADHNLARRNMCGNGDQEGVRCGYRPYFPRRCPECYLGQMCAPDMLAALERAITGEGDAKSE